MARIKGGQKLVWMNKLRPVPRVRRAQIVKTPPLWDEEAGLREGEYYGDDAGAPSESEEVFRAGYTDPRVQPQTGPFGMIEPFFTPEQQAKEDEINNLNAQIDSLITKAGVDPRTGEKTEKEPAPQDEFRGPENEFRGPEREYQEDPKKPKPQSNELVDVLKEMNKAIKAYRDTDTSPGQKDDTSWKQGAKDSPYFGTPAVDMPPPPPSKEEAWRFNNPSGMPREAIEQANQAAALETVGSSAAAPFLFSDQEIMNAAALTEVPSDRLILPPAYATRADAAADVDRASEMGQPLPPVVFIKDENEYLVLANDEELGRFVWGAEDIKRYNEKLLPAIMQQQQKNQ